jgi:hypothetical protein
MAIDWHGGFAEVYGAEIEGDAVAVQLLWLDMMPPATFEIPGIGKVAAPAKCVGRMASALVLNTRLQLIKSTAR